MRSRVDSHFDWGSAFATDALRGARGEGRGEGMANEAVYKAGGWRWM
jgi:hypothetical protein